MGVHLKGWKYLKIFTFLPFYCKIWEFPVFILVGRIQVKGLFCILYLVFNSLKVRWFFDNFNLFGYVEHVFNGFIMVLIIEWNEILSENLKFAVLIEVTHSTYEFLDDVLDQNLTLSWRRPLSYRNQSIDLRWFLHGNGLRHGRVKYNAVVDTRN